MTYLNLRFPFRQALFFLFFAVPAYLWIDREGLLLTTSLSPAWKPLFKGMTFLIFPPLHLGLWGAAFGWAKMRRSSLALPFFEIFSAQCASVAFVRIFKLIFGRARPDIFLKKGIFGFYGWSENSHFHSFPSGHTIAAFTLATSLALLFPRYRWAFIGGALFLSMSRPLLSDHFLSDVLGTAAIGLGMGGVVHTLITIITRRYTYEKA